MENSKVSCEVWYDQTWWEAELPASWTFRQDQSIKGWPCLFESPNRARLWINTSKHVDISGWDLTIAPSELSTEQKKAFLLAASGASQLDISELDVSKMKPHELAMMQHRLVMNRSSTLASARPKLKRHDAGELVGFTFARQQQSECGWAGYFSHDPWMLNVAFNSPPGADQDSEVALSVLASVRFRGPN